MNYYAAFINSTNKETGLQVITPRIMKAETNQELIERFQKAFQPFKVLAGSMGLELSINMVEDVILIDQAYFKELLEAGTVEW